MLIPWWVSDSFQHFFFHKDVDFYSVSEIRVEIWGAKTACSVAFQELLDFSEIHLKLLNKINSFILVLKNQFKLYETTLNCQQKLAV